MWPGPSLSPSGPHGMPPSLVSRWPGIKYIHVWVQCFLTIWTGGRVGNLFGCNVNPLVLGCPTSARFILHIWKGFAHLFTLRSPDLPNISGSPSCPTLACPWCCWCYWVWSAKAWLSPWLLLGFILKDMCMPWKVFKVATLSLTCHSCIYSSSYLYHITYYQITFITPYHTISYHIFHIITNHIISNQIRAYHIKSYDIILISYHINSNHIKS